MILITRVVMIMNGNDIYHICRVQSSAFLSLGV